MVLDDYDLRKFGYEEGARHVQVPSGHPAFMELDQGRAKPVAAVREQGSWVYLFTIQDWKRVAAKQRTQVPRDRSVESKGRSK
jgi:hypothetical protein